MAAVAAHGKILPTSVRERYAETVRTRVPQGDPAPEEGRVDALAATLAEAEAIGCDPARPTASSGCRSQRAVGQAEIPSTSGAGRAVPPTATC